MSGNTERLNTALSGRYRIERQLGQGGMATVYLAQDLKHDRKVAVKVLKPELAAVLGAERFVVEIKTTAALQHPHILPLFDSGTADGFLYYVMPFIEGETLRDKLNRETQLGIEESVRIARDIADALDYAHRHGVIHRDIKPENILLHDGRPMVADFGIALALSAAAGGRMTETGLSLGTPHYMSPEQATAEKEITGRSDIYSLASMLYEMLAGQPPHMGGSAQQIIMKIIAEPAGTVTQHRKSVPANVAAALQKALEKLPADRFESAKAFADALINPQFATGITTAGAPAARGIGRGWIAVGVAAGILLGVIGARVAMSGGASAATAAAQFTQRTYAREPIHNARWSSDGKTILYTSSDLATGAPRMRIVRPEYPEPQPFGPAVAHLLAVSSQNEVALLLKPVRVAQRVYRGTLARMSIGGGSPREVIDNVQEADWSPDGTQFAITRKAGDHDQIEYPVGKVLYASPAGSYLSDLRVSADGQRVAFFLHPLLYDDRGFVAVVDAKGALTRNEREFGGLEGLAWAGDDHAILFTASEAGPWVVKRWRVGESGISNALPNAGTLTMYDVRAGHWLVSRDDVNWMILARPPGAERIRDITWLDGSQAPKMSADGQMVAFTDQSSLSGSLYGVMIRSSNGDPAVRLGDGNADGISPDKKWVLADVPTSPRQYRLYPTGAGAFRPLSWPKLEDVAGVVFLRDNKTLYVCGNEPKRAGRCYTSGLEGGDVTPVTPDSMFGSPRSDMKAFVAPRDGKWWLFSMDGKTRREIPGLHQGPLRWSPDGKALWVFTDGPARQRKVESVDVASGRRTTLFTVDELQGQATPFVALMSVADDGRSYVYFTSTVYSILFTVDGIK